MKLRISFPDCKFSGGTEIYSVKPIEKFVVYIKPGWWNW